VLVCYVYVSLTPAPRLRACPSTETERAFQLPREDFFLKIKIEKKSLRGKIKENRKKKESGCYFKSQNKKRKKERGAQLFKFLLLFLSFFLKK
jgi:hypothetical protein